MLFKDEISWLKAKEINHPEYDWAIDLTEKWVEAMERDLRHGCVLENIIENTKKEVDPEDNLSGLIFSCCVSVLRKAWIHGEKLVEFYQQKINSIPKCRFTLGSEEEVIEADIKETSKSSPRTYLSSISDVITVFCN